MTFVPQNSAERRALKLVRKKRFWKSLQAVCDRTGISLERVKELLWSEYYGDYDENEYEEY